MARELLTLQDAGDALCATTEAELPKIPRRTPAERRRDAALKEALLAGAVPLRDPRKLGMLKPVMMKYDPDTSHMDNCTVCNNQRGVRRASSRYKLPMRHGAVHLLADEAALSFWRDVALVLEQPRKQPAYFLSTSRPCNATVCHPASPSTCMADCGGKRTAARAMTRSRSLGM